MAKWKALPWHDTDTIRHDIIRHDTLLGTTPVYWHVQSQKLRVFRFVKILPSCILWLLPQGKPLLYEGVQNMEDRNLGKFNL